MFRVHKLSILYGALAGAGSLTVYILQTSVLRFFEEGVFFFPSRVSSPLASLGLNKQTNKQTHPHLLFCFCFFRSVLTLRKGACCM